MSLFDIEEVQLRRPTARGKAAVQPFTMTTQKTPIFGNRHHPHDPVWHVQLAVFGALVLQLVLPDRFVVGPRYSMVILEAMLLVALVITTPRLPIFQSVRRRINVLALLGLIGGTNAYALLRVTQLLLVGGGTISGPNLVLAALNIYLTNIIVFALIYWEMDGGGPGKRRSSDITELDFYFQQNRIPAYDRIWHATFIDYLYVSATNATAFSPADTMPMSRRAKMLMLTQALIALITLVLVAARAVSILV